MKKGTLLIVGGGTGGHISPGIALYEECVNNNIQAFLLVGKRDKRFTYLQEVKESDLLYYGAPSITKNVFRLPLALIQFVMAILKARRLFKKLQVNHVIGMGGYVSAPALFAARWAKISIWLCEQNSVPGRVTTMCARYAEKIFSTFSDTAEYLKQEHRHKLQWVGNPIRKKILTSETKQAAKQFFNLGHCKRIILAIGGSQGAVKINELIMGLKLNYADEFKDVGIIWCTGAYSYNMYRTKVQEDSNMGSIYISPFVERVGMAYTACDIAISRSGAGVMMELAAMNVPSILIPYPHAAMDHQNKNADAFVRNGAAIKVSNAEALPGKVAPILFTILNSEQKLQAMKNKAAKEAKIDAAQDILQTILGA